MNERSKRVARIVAAVMLALLCIGAFRAGDWVIGLILVTLAGLVWPRTKPAHKVATRLHK